MATRGSIPRMMELAGIDMLPPEAGIPMVRRELTAGGRRGEVVVAQRLGILSHEPDATGGLDAARVPVTGPMCVKVVSMGPSDGLRVETTLDPKEQPFLRDHRIGGTAVLPGVMGMEAFAEAAACLLPGWNISSIEDVEFLAPFKFYRDEPRTVTVDAMLYGDGEDIVADCRLTGSRSVATQPEPQVTTHFTGRVRLSRAAPALVSEPLPPTQHLVAEAAGIYQVYFHGPAYRVLDTVWKHGDDGLLGVSPHDLPENHVPAGLPLLAAPRMLELCFQTAGIADMQNHARLALPHGIDSVRLHGHPAGGAAPWCAVVSPGAAPDSYDARVLDAAGSVCLEMRGYRTIALPEAVDVSPLKAVGKAAGSRQ